MAPKSGKVRSVPISAELEARIIRHWREYGQPNSAITAFRRALARTTIKLPKGQAAHALRHTFASHFIQNGGKHRHATAHLGPFELGYDHALRTSGT